jgi:hypothetical protein
MAVDTIDRQAAGTWTTAMTRRRRVAWLVILIADVGLILWGAAAALAPGHLLGPGSAPILTAGYEGFTKLAWAELADPSREYITLLFRLYGAYIVAFGLLAIAVTTAAFRRGDGWAWWALLFGNTIAFGAAMTYDWIVGAIGPFEITEYVGLAAIYGALAVTAPFLAAERSGRWVARRQET